MFQSLSATEILTIAVVALIVIGPRQLPGIARRIGRYLGEIKRVAAGFRDDLEREVGPIKEPLQDLKETGREVSRPLGDVRKSLDEAAVAAKRPADKRGGEEGDGGKGDGPAVRWVAPEPKTGVPPDQAWEGLNDPVPEGIAVPPPPPPPGYPPPPPPPVPPAEPAPSAPSVSPPAGSDERPPPPAGAGENPPSQEAGDSGAAR